MKQKLLEMIVTGLGYVFGLIFAVLSFGSAAIVGLMTVMGESVARLRDAKGP